MKGFSFQICGLNIDNALVAVFSALRSSMKQLVEDISRSGPDIRSSGMLDQINRTLQLGSHPRYSTWCSTLTLSWYGV